MNAPDRIDAARIDLALGELRLPGIKLIWTALAATADHSDPGRIASAILRKAGRRPVSSLLSPNRRWWSEAGDGSNVIWRKPACRRAKPSTGSTSPPCR